MRFASSLGITALMLFSGCGNESQLTASESEIAVAPALTDLGTVPVGTTVTFEIQADVITGNDVKVKTVSVTNIEGTFFSKNGDGTGTATSEDPLVMTFTYTPTQVGYHRATVDLTHDGKDGGEGVSVDVRARAVLPEATLWPLGLDFGPVAGGSSATRQLTVSNQSDLDLTISDSNVSNGVFELATPLPLTVGGGDEQVVQVAFNPIDGSAQSGTLTLSAGTVDLPQVSLRGNDCENGDPEAYDVDGDGYTMCGGDCDDNDLDVRPGAIEDANGVDDDCDGDTDEGTAWADDDGDGFCDDNAYCSDGSTPGDCSDSADPGADTDQVNPGETEIMNNGIDDDCDGVVDQGTTDADGDGYSPAGGDCDDNNGAMYPGAAELPDFLNNDCDLFTDEGTVYYDDDGDGYCEHAVTCSDGSMTADCDDDVTDRDGIGGPDGRPTNPGAGETYDWRDNDCDGTVDEGTVGYDDDSDGYTEVGGDCDDNNAAMSPAFGNCP